MFQKITLHLRQCPNARVDDMVNHVIAEAPLEHTPAIGKATACAQADSDRDVTLDELDAAMVAFYEMNEAVLSKHKPQNRDRKSVNSPRSADGETVLTAFDGTCHNCGKNGHKKADCPQRKQSG